MPLPEILAILMVRRGLRRCCSPAIRSRSRSAACRSPSRRSATSLGAMDIGLLYALPQRIFGVMTNTVLLAIPLFIFMGVMLERSRIAEDLLETMGRLFGSLPGGLGISVVLVGVLLAAAKGVVGATVVTIALITLPTMLRHGYDKRLAAGHRGGDRDARANPAARDRAGAARRPAQQFAIRRRSSPRAIFAPESVSVSDLFAGRDRAGADAGRALSPVPRRGRDRAARRRAADPAEPAAPRALRSRGVLEGADRAGAADRRGARLDPDRARDADRSRGGRRGRRGAARGVACRAARSWPVALCLGASPR